jgi:hypothetical protein
MPQRGHTNPKKVLEPFVRIKSLKASIFEAESPRRRQERTVSLEKLIFSKS